MRKLRPRLFVRRHVQALCYEMRQRLCAVKCFTDFELGELRYCRSCSAAIWRMQQKMELMEFVVLPSSSGTESCCDFSVRESPLSQRDRTGDLSVQSQSS
ncbi:hypothetical protein AVEN_153767-1 [Araneus ventricosus]|uniref:Uncharacterized protein n=1 Tax=Araneus ventricosus TaxID=182803 RepID=A0A4Y2JVT3_ARAVE|nr:hypothetical protein AVEN_153767-1 [Araneus ventricosus]